MSSQFRVLFGFKDGSVQVFTGAKQGKQSKIDFVKCGERVTLGMYQIVHIDVS